MNQLTLFDAPETKPIARATDPEPSHTAAADIQPKLGRLEDRMLQAFRELGQPSTAREAAEHCMSCFDTGGTDMDTHRKRYTGLRDKGRIVSCGTKECRHTGRVVTAFVLTDRRCR